MSLTSLDAKTITARTQPEMLAEAQRHFVPTTHRNFRGALSGGNCMVFAGEGECS
jgi:hypothetical protein